MTVERPPHAAPLRLIDGALPAGPRDDRPVVVHAIGARAELVALAPVIAALGERRAFRQVLVRAGAGDPRLFDPVAVDLGLPPIDHDLTVAPGRHAEETAAVLTAFEALLLDLSPDLVVVAGDSDASLACALAAGKLDLALARVGAGMRSGDWTQSPEINRVLGDRLCDTLLAPDAESVDQLLAEGVPDGRIRLVGSTAVDVLRQFEASARARAAWTAHGVERGGYVLAEIHGAAILEDPRRLTAAVRGLIGLAAHGPVILPVAPRTLERLGSFDMAPALREAGVRCTPVRGYVESLSLRAGAGAIVTDAGEAQDEACAIGIRCFTLGTATERRSTLVRGTNILLGDDLGAIAAVRPASGPPIPCAVPLWEGRAAERVADALVAHYSLALSGGAEW
jgi:UDP-N-acetylglucosamine 2-epimerase (non-hydrolysing)